MKEEKNVGDLLDIREVHIAGIVHSCMVLANRLHK